MVGGYGRGRLGSWEYVDVEMVGMIAGVGGYKGWTTVVERKQMAADSEQPWWRGSRWATDGGQLWWKGSRGSVHGCGAEGVWRTVRCCRDEVRRSASVLVAVVERRVGGYSKEGFVSCGEKTVGNFCEDGR